MVNITPLRRLADLLILQDSLFPRFRAPTDAPRVPSSIQRYLEHDPAIKAGNNRRSVSHLLKLQRASSRDIHCTTIARYYCDVVLKSSQKRVIFSDMFTNSEEAQPSQIIRIQIMNIYY